MASFISSENRLLDSWLSRYRDIGHGVLLLLVGMGMEAGVYAFEDNQQDKWLFFGLK